MGYFIGIDAGGSKTDCVLGDESHVLGRAAAGSCKLSRVTETEARAALREAILAACAAAGVSEKEIAHVCIGASGATREDVVRVIRDGISAVVPASVSMVGDMIVALEAAFGAEPGVIVIGGTGSIAFGRNQRGDTARAGGWGAAISDEGSGEWIGRHAVAAAMRAHDKGQNTGLLPAILNTWHIGARDDLVQMANTIPPPNFAELFPLVRRVAEQGDSVASHLLMRAGVELADMCKIVIRKLWPGPQPVNIAAGGGAFLNSEVIQQSFRNSVHAERPQAEIGFRPIDPALGALSLARRVAAESVAGKS